MDYYYYSKNEDYFALVRQFKPISEVLVNEYKAFQTYGHNSEDVFVFGFSFGAQLSLDLGRKVNNGIDAIARMDGKLNILNIVDRNLRISPFLSLWANLNGLSRDGGLEKIRQKGQVHSHEYCLIWHGEERLPRGLEYGKMRMGSGG